VEYLRFQQSEIDRVAPRPGEDGELVAERALLANAEKLRRLCGEAYGRLYDDDSSALSSLAAVWKRVTELRELDPRFGPYLEGREAVEVHLGELATVPPRVRRAHRGRTRPASGTGGPVGLDRAPEEKVRARASRRFRAAGRGVPRNWLPWTPPRRPSRTSSGGSRQRRIAM